MPNEELCSLYRFCAFFSDFSFFSGTMMLPKLLKPLVSIVVIFRCCFRFFCYLTFWKLPRDSFFIARLTFRGRFLVTRHFQNYFLSSCRIRFYFLLFLRTIFFDFLICNSTHHSSVRSSSSSLSIFRFFFHEKRIRFFFLLRIFIPRIFNPVVPKKKKRNGKKREKIL